MDWDRVTSCIEFESGKCECSKLVVMTCFAVELSVEGQQ